MLEIIARLRELGSNHEGLQDALDRFEEGTSHDTEEMMERLESRGASAPSDSQFANAPPAAAETSGDFLRVLVLSGTALKQFCVPYKGDDRVSVVLRALQTQLGPTDSAALHDYELYVMQLIAVVCFLLVFFLLNSFSRLQSRCFSSFVALC